MLLCAPRAAALCLLALVLSGAAARSLFAAPAVRGPSGGRSFPLAAAASPLPSSAPAYRFQGPGRPEPASGQFAWGYALAGASLVAAAASLPAAAVASPDAESAARAARMAAFAVPRRLRTAAGPRAQLSSDASEEDKGFYAVGYNIGKQLQQQLAPIETRDVAPLLAGIGAAMTDAPPEVPLQEYVEKAMRVAEARQTAMAEKGREAGAAFLKTAAAEEGATQTASGLVIKTLEEGSGDSPSADASVEVHYEGKLIDGTVFDSSYQRGETITFPLSGVIKGWTEGLQLMKPGGKALLTIPPEIAYGERGSPPVIPPLATLVFTVELIAVK